VTMAATPACLPAYTHDMAGSLKDALKKSGLVEEKREPRQDPKVWREELPDDDGKAQVPFEAPALIKPKPRPHGR
jgi:hypothetical protein